MNAPGRVPSEGRIRPPYGGKTHCQFDGCQVPLSEDTEAFLHTDRRTGKWVVFCGGCSLEMRLHYALQFPLVAL